MIAALACAVAALLVAPPAGAARRFARSYPRRPRSCPPRPNAAVAVLPAALVAQAVGGVGAVVAVLVLAATLRIRRRRSARRRLRETERRHLLDGLDVVIAELRVGAHPAAAAAVAAQECAGAAARGFAVGAARCRLGGSAADGLRDATVAGSGTPPVCGDLERVADAWRVAERHGLALAELLAASRADLGGRIRFGHRTESALAGARASAAVLAGLPLLGILLGQSMGAAPLRVLLGGGLGGVLLALGTTLVCAGLFWTDAIVERVTS